MEMEKKDVDMSSSKCTKENKNDLPPLSSLIAPERNSLPEKDCSLQCSGAVSCLGGMGGEKKLEDSELSDHCMEEIASTILTMKDDIGSVSGQPAEKEDSELLDRKMNGPWPKSGKDVSGSRMPASSHEKQHINESSSSDSTHVVLPTSSIDSCQDTSVDAKAGQDCKATYLTVCVDKCDLQETTNKGFGLGMASHVEEKLTDNAIVSPQKCQDLVGTSDNAHNVRGRDWDKQHKMTDFPVNIENGIPKVELPGEKVTEAPDLDRAEPLHNTVDVVPQAATEENQNVLAYKEASVSSSYMHQKNREANSLCQDEMADSIKNYCIKESECKIQRGNKRDKHRSFSSRGAVETKDFKNVQLCMEVEDRSFNTGLSRIQESYDGLCCQESSCLTTKFEVLSAHEHGDHLPPFDLNEEILSNEVGYVKDLIKESASYYSEYVAKPVPVMAKSGIPLCLPVPWKQSEGEPCGWKGSTATSAFQPTFFSKIGNRNGMLLANNDSDSIKNIDLNIAVGEFGFETEWLPEKQCLAESSFPSGESSAEVSSTRSGKLCIDLNHIIKDDDNFHQSSPPASSRRNSVRHFDLNDEPTSTDVCDDAQPQGLRSRMSNNPYVSFKESARQTDSSSVGSVNWVGWSSLQGSMPVAGHGKGKPFLGNMPDVLLPDGQIHRLAPPVQQRLTSTPVPPPHAFLYNNVFCFNPNNQGLSSTMYSPPGTFSCVPGPEPEPCGTPFIPQILGPHALPVFPVSQNFIEIPGGPQPGNIAILRPCFDPNPRMPCMESETRGNAGQVFIPGCNSRVEQQLKSFQLALPATPMKRREPEGGWNSNQPPHTSN